MSQSFTEYLVEAANEESGTLKLFNPTRFVPKIKQALDLMINAAGDEGEKMDELIILEMISMFKEVLVNRLKPFKEGVKVTIKQTKAEKESGKTPRKLHHAKDGSYKERKDDKDDIATIKEIEKEIKMALVEAFNEKHYKAGIAKFMSLVVSPIMHEIERVSPKKAYAAIDTKSYKEDAKDAFGALMKKVINSDIFSSPDDAKVAKKTLQKMAQTANKESRKTRRLSKGQRLKLIRRAAEKVQDKKE